MVGIIVMNIQRMHKKQECDMHIATAEKYLTELNYEQAIVEYSLVLEIEPKEERALDGLEQVSLAYAQVLIDEGNYEEAILILNEGYEQTGRESLQVKIEEIREEQEKVVIEFPFEITDIKICGYDLMDNYYEEVCATLGCPIYGYSDNEYRHSYSYISEAGDNAVGFYYDSGSGHSDACYSLNHIPGWVAGRIEYSYDLSGDPLTEYREVIDCPIVLGDSYEDWCRIMQLDDIEDKKHEEFLNGSIKLWKIKTNWGDGIYQEEWYDGNVVSVFVWIQDEPQFSIWVDFSTGDEWMAHIVCINYAEYLHDGWMELLE